MNHDNYIHNIFNENLSMIIQHLSQVFNTKIIYKLTLIYFVILYKQGTNVAHNITGGLLIDFIYLYLLSAFSIAEPLWSLH